MGASGFRVAPKRERPTVKYRVEDPALCFRYIAVGNP